MLINFDFCGFLGDLNVVGREVFKDLVFVLLIVVEEVGKKFEFF